MRGYIQPPTCFITGEASGIDGELIIKSGETVTLPAGTYKDYTRVDIQAGGKLIIDGSSSGAITEICCRRIFTLNGNIYANNLPGTGGTYYLPLGVTQNPYVSESPSYTISQAYGGAGGSGQSGSNSGGSSSPGYGGAGASNGLGGGGGGAVSGIQNGHQGDGGSGGSDGSAGRHVSGGRGNVTFGDGDDGQQSQGGNGGGSGGGGGYNTGCGGGGGWRGTHGLGLYIICKKIIVGTGKIYCGRGGVINGRDPMQGYRGGNGHNAGFGVGDGGKGGGGAGGSSGSLWIRYHGDLDASTLVGGYLNDTTIQGGQGGSSGSGGAGNPGQPGQNGNNGLLDLLVW